MISIPVGRGIIQVAHLRQRTLLFVSLHFQRQQVLYMRSFEEKRAAAKVLLTGLNLLHKLGRSCESFFPTFIV